jgi:glycosyltransferase involved in cell wall biosynthesis
MTRYPRITIITPNYNGGSYLSAALESVLSQNYPNLELMVFDGGSTDNSREIIQRYAERLAFWTSEPDGGQVAAINRGLQMATGDVVNWLNSDDVLLPGSLDLISRAFLDAPETSVICGWNVAFDAHRIVRHRIFPQPPPELLLSRRLLPQDAVYWRMDVTRSIGLLDRSFGVRFDMEYWCRMVARGFFPRVLPHFISGFRVVDGQKSSSLAEQSDLELQRIVEMYKSQKELLSGPFSSVRIWKLRRNMMRIMQRFGVRRYLCQYPIQRILSETAGS